MHVSVLEPTCGENCPLGHAVHGDDPTFVENFPAGQSEHVPSCFGSGFSLGYLPSGHATEFFPGVRDAGGFFVGSKVFGSKFTVSFFFRSRFFEFAEPLATEIKIKTIANSGGKECRETICVVLVLFSVGLLV